MVPAIAPKKPSAQERIELMSGPRVDIYVGIQKKHHSLPKALLCYYSNYFDRFFNDNFVEGKTQKLTLDEDKVEHFELLIEYMLSGGCVHNDHVKITGRGTTGLQKCMEFVEYTDKYGMGDASKAIHDALYTIVSTKNKSGIYLAGTTIQLSNVDTIFKVTSPGNPLRPLIAKAAFAVAGMTGNAFSKQEREIDGFATELLAIMRPALRGMKPDGPSSIEWSDPFIEGNKRYN